MTQRTTLAVVLVSLGRRGMTMAMCLVRVFIIVHNVTLEASFLIYLSMEMAIRVKTEAATEK